MKTYFSIEKPDSVECTLRITMPLRDWKRLREELPRSHPGWRIQAAINEVVRVAEDQITTNEKQIADV